MPAQEGAFAIGDEHDDGRVYAREKFMRFGFISTANHVAGAFREYCRAMLPLTRALQKMRNKEEVFQPVWDLIVAAVPAGSGIT